MKLLPSSSLGKVHSLNLAIGHACKEPLVRNMLGTLQQIAFAFH